MTGNVLTSGAAAPRPPQIRRYLALYFPFLSAEREMRQKDSAKPDKAPLAIIARSGNALRVAGVNAAAARLGISEGLTLADARARLPELAAADHDPAADSRLLQALAAAAERYTPLAALDPLRGILLDITGCAHLFGGEAVMAGRIQARFFRAGLSARAAVAGTPDAARAFARHGREALVVSSDDAAFAAALPAAALGLDAQTALALARAGLKTIGDLACRPAQPLAARFGEALITKLRRVTGFEDIRITPLRPLPDCMAEQHFPEPLIQAEAIEATLAKLIRDVCEALARRGAGGRAFEASFFRADGAVRRITAGTGRPSRDEKLIAKLFHERLEALADPLDPGFGFDALRLSAGRAAPLLEQQPEFYARASGACCAKVESGFAQKACGNQKIGTRQLSDQNSTRFEDEEFSGLIDRIAARQGRARVLSFMAEDTHNPLRAERLVPAQDVFTPGAGWLKPEPGEPPSRPLHLFTPPQPIETLAEVPDGPPLRFRWRRRQHEIARAEGPERIAPEWHREGAPASYNSEHAVSGRPEPAFPQHALTRDYYRVEDSEGCRFWVFRQGFYGEAPGQPRWFVHGLFA